jgi:hypothetical protein
MNHEEHIASVKQRARENDPSWPPHGVLRTDLDGSYVAANANDLGDGVESLSHIKKAWGSLSRFTDPRRLMSEQSLADVQYILPRIQKKLRSLLEVIDNAAERLGVGATDNIPNPYQQDEAA